MEEKQSSNKKTPKWAIFSFWSILYILFSIWMENLWLLCGLIVLVDIYITKYIPWGAWKQTKNAQLNKLFEFVDDILYALIAVYIINLFVFQNYQIPSPSLEKTLLVGDFLCVSKLSYGPRVPNTPLSFPLVQNTLPIFGCNSYVEWPAWGYKRVKGFGSVKRNDIVVFNFPAGDTVALRMQNPDYYMLVHDLGREKIHALPDVYGKVIYRPVDKRENFVKRCIGMPGDNLQLIENQVYINGEKMKNPQKMQLNYYVETDGTYFSEEQFRALEVSKSDRKMVSFNESYHHSLLETIGFKMNANSQSNQVYLLPLTEKAVEMVRKLPFVKQVVLDKDMWSGVYPVGYNLGWARDNYGPVWIPQKGQTIELNPQNLALYTRCIVNYENNTLETLPDGKIRINGQETTTYTFRYDYYFMLGDNRHNSADSRMWGFVPEDHIVGKPLMVWLSLDKDRNLLNGGIRWNRMFRKVSAE